jgi:TIG domain
VSAEGAGTEVLVTQTYGAGIFLPAGPLLTVSTGPVLTANTMPQPNSTHASSLSKATNPALTTATPGNTTAGAGNTTLVIVGTNFTPQSVVWYGGVAYPTVYNSATSLSVAAVPKKATAGTVPVNVVTGGVVTTASVNATYV